MSPPNDDFADATVLSGGSGSVAFDLTGATVETSEPGTVGGTTVWFAWTAPSSTTVQFDTAASAGDPDTYLSVWTGTSVGALTFVVGDDDSGNDPAVGDPDYGTSLLQFTPTPGTTYYVRVDAYNPGVTGVLTWGSYTPPPPAPTVTSLRGVNAYNPASTFLITFDGQQVYATPDDYWVQVAGTGLEFVTAVAFIKTGEPDINADFHVLSPTLLEVKTPYTVTAHSRVRVTSGGGTATSVRNITPIFAGPWVTPPGTVTLDNLAHPGDPYQFPTTSQRILGTDGSKVVGTHDDGSAPPVMTYADVVNNGTGSGFAPGAGAAVNTILNSLRDSSISFTGLDATIWSVTQAGVRIDLNNLFYRLLADLGVPGYDDTSLLPAGAVVAIPDGTDAGDVFFKNRLSALTVTATGRNDYPDGYSPQVFYTGPSGTWVVFDTTGPTFAMRSDTLEFRQATAGVAGVPDFQSTSALNSAALLTSATVNPDPPLRIPADQELDPVSPLFADPPADVVIDIPALDALSDDLRVLYTTVFTSARTYNDPPDPGQSPMLTYTLEGGGTDTTQTAHYRGGSSFRTDPQVRVRVTWHPPRYRYFYTEPLPLATAIPLRQVGRADGSRQYPRAHLDGLRQVGRIP